MSHWDPALRSLQNSKIGLYGPESFIGYLRDNDEDPNQYRTAANLSIDTRQALSNRLEKQETMVLRLGRASNGPGTQFALINVSGRLDDFFINEDEFSPDERHVIDFSAGGRETDTLGQNAKDMLDVYRALPTFSETSFVNFALSTGLVSRALDLDNDEIGAAPTTVASTFDFKFEPHPDLPSVVHHNNGQVEIDALIVARREGERVLLVVEAKQGKSREMAKHKLVYPALAARASLSIDVDQVVPVYIRAQSVSDAIQYSLYECSDIPDGEDKPSLGGLRVIDDHHFEVRLD